jgi:hypothetical protein
VLDRGEVVLYTGAASRAYPYYTDEDKVWVPGPAVQFAPASLLAQLAAGSEGSVPVTLLGAVPVT